MKKAILFLALVSCASLSRADLRPPMIRLTSTLQSGATFFVSSGTVATQLNIPNGTSATNAAAYGQIGVFQVVFSSEAAGGTFTSGSYVVGGASATITPSSVSHRIKITINGSWGHSSATAQSEICIGKAGVSLFTTANCPLQLFDPVAGKSLPYVMTWIDSPATTSPVSYQTMAATSGASLTTGGSQSTGSTTTMILEEIN